MSQERSGNRAGGPPRNFGRPGHGPGRFGMPVQKPKDFMGTLKRLLRYLRPHSFQLALVVLMAVLSTAFSIFSPRVMGYATTKLFEGVMAKLKGVPGAHIDYHYIFRILTILVILYVVSAIFSYFQQYLMAGVAQKTVFDLRKEVDQKLFRLPLRFFDQRSTGDLLSRVTNDVDNISSTLQQSLTQLITAIVTLIGILVMMLSINGWLTLFTFLTLPLSLIATKQFATRSQNYFKGQQKALGKLNGHVEEMVTGHTIVKAFGREKASIKQFNDINNELYESGWRAQFVSGMIMPIMMFIGNIGYVIIAVVGGIFVTKRMITIGDVQAFLQYSRQFNQPITQVANISNVIQSTIASAERVFELLDETEQSPEPIDAPKLKAPKGNISFKNVSFSYKQESPLIEDLNINVKSGQKVAIVGPTGAGKTTLVNLLMRFYEVDKGTITIDDVPITAFERDHLRGLFGMVLQDTWLFNGTIRDNIAYGKEGATDQEVIEAAQAAYADPFIRTLPDGYETILNEETSNLSQGQKQLLTIARAFLADPAFLILDEATSSVDTRTELYIQKAMEKLMKNRTSFVIAHRLSTIRDADLILVMNHGRVIEQGTHNELLIQDGFYADLYNSQFLGKSSESV
ncbi:ABC transporter ATP-binding protein [Pullulanibacillus sp. KACC 23026]|uniref:ABC transporter ATP-binding protein n=1 Tax=Pullulanibacillus sp. KACC 23026 TaxID=3028315 RepID=UPI0023AE93F0|nr:ABC transporter ATP-binding protein [Pullulanibacillus sp. KACC 23026]WEG12569.1 ABC transporter ATP-binding protein [Pullulanibacillus sp. KACC 23026]